MKYPPTWTTLSLPLNCKASRKPVSQPWRFAHDHLTSPDTSIVTNSTHIPP